MNDEWPTARERQGTRTDRLFEAFSERRRRSALRILAASATPIAFEELAERIVADEADEADGADAGPSVDDVALSFHHRDLPKLAESGLVSYGGPGGRVEYTATDRLDEAVGALLDFDARFE